MLLKRNNQIHFIAINWIIFIFKAYYFFYKGFYLKKIK